MVGKILKVKEAGEYLKKNLRGVTSEKEFEKKNFIKKKAN
jgi:hypothetical protein